MKISTNKKTLKVLVLALALPWVFLLWARMQVADWSATQKTTTAATVTTTATTPAAPHESEGIFCTTLVETDDGYSRAVCKNTLSGDVRYTATTLYENGGGSSLERITKEAYDRQITWKECVDEAEFKHPSNGGFGPAFDAKMKAIDACSEAREKAAK